MLDSVVDKFRDMLDDDEEPLTKVMKVTEESLESRPVIQSNIGSTMILYGPKTDPDGDNPSDEYYEIVMRKPLTDKIKFYSIFRSEGKELAEEKFNIFKDKIPFYLVMTQECKTNIVQKVCDLLSAHPGWSITHMVVYFGEDEALKECQVLHQINEIDPDTSMTAVMVAVKEKNMKMVQKLISLNCSLDMVDCEGNSVFHYAATNDDMLKVLTKIESPSLNALNKKGYTPFHLACRANDFDCMRILLKAGADVNHQVGKGSENSCLPGICEILEENHSKLDQQDIKHGGTPLHWAKTREVMEALIEKECDLNAVNFNGKTALHTMVASGRLECAVALLSRSADLNIKDKDGNTALHIAVTKQSVAMVQALIVFGADIEVVNNAGHTARHCIPIEMSNNHCDKMLYILHAVGAKRCAPGTLGCKAGCADNGDYNGMPPPPVAGKANRDILNCVLSNATKTRAAKDNRNNQGRLLCLDGGGIRGLVLIQILLSVEKEVGEPIVKCFDWIAGTSTGGILAIALGCGMTLRECQGLYFRMKNLAFVGSRPYDSEALELILRECFGPKKVMMDIENPKLMVLSLLADRKPVDLHIFRNYQSAEEILEQHKVTPTLSGSGVHKDAGHLVSIVQMQSPPPASQQLAWQAARSSGAAPSYFRAFGRYLDGGLIGNNPTLDALTELAELKSALEETGQVEEAKKTNLKVVLSCGTGSRPVAEQKDIDFFLPESVMDVPRFASTLSSIANLLVGQVTKSGGRIVERARSWCYSLGVPYYRFSPRLSRHVDLDERKDEELVNMLWETMVYMRVNHHFVEELATLLK